MTDEWRCFHCDEVFTDRQAAAHHFGPWMHAKPACQIDIVEVREMELELSRYREEDTALHREIHGLQSAMAVAKRRAEEEGYARGLADAQRFPEELGLCKQC